MKKVTLLILFLIPIISYSQLNIVITNNIVPLYTSDGDTLSTCRDSMIIFEAEVTGGLEPYEYFWDFDDGYTDTGDSVTYIYEENLDKPYDGGGGFRVKLKVIDANSDEGFMIQPVKVAIPPNYSDTKVDLPEGQIGICKGSPAPLDGKAYPDIWEDEPVYEIEEDPRIEFSDLNSYESSLTFDEFSLGSSYASGDIDSVGLGIIHSNMGNVKVSLSCEEGNTVILKDFDLTNNGILGDTVNNLPYLYFWSASSANGTMNNITADPIPAQDYLPDESFDNFIGCSLNGTWTLTIEDDQPVDSGFVYSWSVIFQEDVLPDVWTFKDTLVQYKIINDIIYGTFWTGDNVEATVLTVIGDTIIGRTYAAPDVDGPNGYNFHVVNNFGCPQDTSITLRVEPATISADKEGGEAKLTVSFTDETSWSVFREWKFGDESLSEFPDTDTISHEYVEKGTYSVVLIASDDFACTDTDTIIIDVLVEPSHLQNLPNMFSPNGDGKNDVYKFTEDMLKGMEEFHLTIYSRWGKKVYETKDMDEAIETGWNGTIMNSGNRTAAPGIYFYVIEAKGKDGNIYEGNRGSEKIEETDPPTIREGTKGIIHLFIAK